MCISQKLRIAQRQNSGSFVGYDIVSVRMKTYFFLLCQSLAGMLYKAGLISLEVIPLPSFIYL